MDTQWRWTTSAEATLFAARSSESPAETTNTNAERGHDGRRARESGMALASAARIAWPFARSANRN